MLLGILCVAKLEVFCVLLGILCVTNQQVFHVAKLHVFCGVLLGILCVAKLQVFHVLLGYPVMIKASAGGGGKGLRIAWNDDETR